MNLRFGFRGCSEAASVAPVSAKMIGPGVSRGCHVHRMPQEFAGLRSAVHKSSFTQPPPPNYNLQSLVTRGHASIILQRRFRGHVAGCGIYLTSEVRPLRTFNSPHFPRLLSTSTPPPVTEKLASPATPKPASGGVVSRKLKVDLRPGPVKPPAKSSARLQDAAATSSASKSSTSSKKSTTAPASSTQGSSQSLLETTKQDLVDAHVHGIIPPPPPGANRIEKVWHQVKEFFKFYVRGMKMVNTHRIQANELLGRVKSGGAPLTRWETRFVATARTDVLKLIPFVLVVLIAEEVIPLIVLYVPSMLPSTCIMPSQRERIDNKRREKQRVFGETMRDEFLAIKEASPSHVALSSVSGRMPLVALCGIFSLSTIGPPFMRRNRLERHLKAIAEDDVLLKQEGMGERLTQPELLEALENRGMSVFVSTLHVASFIDNAFRVFNHSVPPDVNSSTLKSRLRWWLTNVDKFDEGDIVSRRIVLAARSAVTVRSNARAAAGEASQPLLNGSHEDLPGASSSDVLFSIQGDEDLESSVMEYPAEGEVRGKAEEFGHVRFQDDVQVIAPPLRSTYTSREAEYELDSDDLDDGSLAQINSEQQTSGRQRDQAMPLLVGLLDSSAARRSLDGMIPLGEAGVNGRGDRGTVGDVDLEELAAMQDAGGGMFNSITNMANSILGAGIIGLPYAVSKAGFWTGILLLIILGGVTDWTIRLIVTNAKMSGTNSYIGIMNHCFGSSGRAAVSFFQFAFAFGGDSIPHVIRSIFPTLHTIPVLSLLTNRQFVIALCTLGVSYPLSLYRDIHKLSIASGFALVGMLIIVSSVIFEGPPRTVRAQGRPHQTLLHHRAGRVPGDRRDELRVCVPPQFTAHLRQPAHADLGSLRQGHARLDGHLGRRVSDHGGERVHGVHGQDAGQYIEQFFTGARSDVFSRFGGHPMTFGTLVYRINYQNDSLINVARFCFGLNMFTTLPLELFVCREPRLRLHVTKVIEQFFFSHEAFSIQRHLFFTTTILLASMFGKPHTYLPLHIRASPPPIIISSIHNSRIASLLALITCDLGVMLEITGGISATALAFIFPAACYLKLTDASDDSRRNNHDHHNHDHNHDPDHDHDDGHNGDDGDGDDHDAPRPRHSRTRWPAYACVAFGGDRHAALPVPHAAKSVEV
ncbi:hypothetical protein EW146_g9895 [Bondarzewia mesenterica]|uniref:Letm1 RBD domain-containing protein n=1 Tax=Bondarzewia mesenterica TaxID=1095465 RepID=A0A4S4L2I0_9AGAM|nr:hypothetical protein EW146_g9895 [Bondarzewia mesenterica]